MPETIRRALEALDTLYNDDSTGVPPSVLSDGRRVCVTDWKPLEKVVQQHDTAGCLEDVIQAVLSDAHYLYAALVDAGIPWQDARRVLPMGTQTYIHAVYNYVSLRDVLANRLEHVMDWEINCVAQLMLREIRLHCPSAVWQNLGSHSDRLGRAAFAGLESWPPDGKYPAPAETANLPRTHRPEQNPYWVLAPSSMAGGPIKWLWTNGTYPHEAMEKQTSLPFVPAPEDKEQP